MKHVLFGILCTIVCKALFPYPSVDFGKPELINNRQTSYAGQDDIRDNTPIPHVETKIYFSFPDIPIWENEETDEEDETVEGLGEEALHISFGAIISTNASAFDLRASAIPLFILFHSWKHFLS